MQFETTAVGRAPETLRPSGRGIALARDRLASYMAPSPLYRAAALSRALGADVWLKVETTSPIASFKLRGALNTLLTVKESNQAISTVVTSSTGNHGQGVALAAAWLGIPAEIFMPDRSEVVKQVMIQLFGAKLCVGGHDLDEAKERARAHARRTGGVFIDDGEEVAVIEGAGTVGLEIGNGLENVDVVISPMGSGCLASGTALGLKYVQPKARVVAVQSSAAPAMFESYKAHRMMERPANTVADCLVCRVPAQLALETLISHVDECWLVDDSELFAAVRTLAEWGHILVEPGAAAGFAGAWKHREELADKRVVLVLSGANAGLNLLSRALEAPPLFDAKVLSDGASGPQA